MSKSFITCKIVKYLTLISICFICVLVALCAFSACDNKELNSEDKVKDLVSNMTLEEKVGQLFIIRPEAMIDNISLSNIEKETGEA